MSHRLEDVLFVCDEVSVLHEGEIKLTSDTSQLTSKALIEVMTGRELQRHRDDESRVYGKVKLKLRISLPENYHTQSRWHVTAERFWELRVCLVGSIGVTSCYVWFWPREERACNTL